MEIVINNCFGGFSLSNLALKKYVESKGMKAYFYEKVSFNEKYIKVPYDKNGIITYCVSEDLGDTINHKEFMAWIEKNKDKYFSASDIDRTDKDLIKIIKELGSKKASGRCACLKIIKVPNDVNWEIDDYDGIETVQEKHRSWR